MKKSNINTILQVKRVSNYDNVISQWQNGTRPSSTTLWNACKAWAEAQHISRCTMRTDYIDALLRRPFDDECLPFVTCQTGDYVFAAHYDMGPFGKAYWDKDDASYQYSGEDYTSWQRGWTYRNDGVDVYSGPNDAQNCGYYVGETKDGEWHEGGIQRMKKEKATVTLTYDEERLTALRLFLAEKKTQVEDELTKTLDALYGKIVPQPVRHYLDLRGGEIPIPPPLKQAPGQREEANGSGE